jgi:hypothetical protein
MFGINMLTLNELLPLIRNNLICHLDKPLTKDLLETIMLQVNDSIDYYLDKKEQNL